MSGEVKVAYSCLTLCNPIDYMFHGILQARILKWVAFPFSRVSSQPRVWTQVSHTAGRFSTNWATKEAQESNWGLLHCRQILYQLGYQGSMHWLNNVTLRDITWLFIPTLSNQAARLFTRHCEGGVAKRKRLLHLVSHPERSFCIILFDALHCDILIICRS